MTIYEHIGEMHDWLWDGHVVGNTAALKKNFLRVEERISKTYPNIGKAYYVYTLENGNEQWYMPYACPGPFLAPEKVKAVRTKKVIDPNENYEPESYRPTSKDYFDAMTDGMMGDWEDFEGDSDFISDWAGG